MTQFGPAQPCIATVFLSKPRLPIFNGWTSSRKIRRYSGNRNPPACAVAAEPCDRRSELIRHRILEKRSNRILKALVKRMLLVFPRRSDRRQPVTGGRFGQDTRDSSRFSRFFGRNAASKPLKRDLCRFMLVEYCEESMLVLGTRVILNMNAVHLSQVVGYVLNLENICVFTFRLEVIVMAGDN